MKRKRLAKACPACGEDVSALVRQALDEEIEIVRRAKANNPSPAIQRRGFACMSPERHLAISIAASKAAVAARAKKALEKKRLMIGAALRATGGAESFTKDE